jgi:CheY-like chemotaxis protein
LTPPNGPILLVEDNETDVLLLERAFRKVSVRAPLQVVRDGREAVTYLDGKGSYADRTSFPLPAFVLLDLKLPKRSGFEVLEWMRQDSRLRDMPVIVLTSSTETGDVIRAYELGALAYLVKPVGFDELRGLAEILCRYWNAPHGEARAALDRVSVPPPRA